MSYQLQERDAKLVLRAILDAYLSAIEAGGSSGAPSGVLYSAAMASGCSLEMHNQIVDVLVASGKVRKQGHLLFLKEKAS